MTEKEKTEEKLYELVKIPTEHTFAIQRPNGEIIQQEIAIVEILNLLKEIKSTLG